MINEIIKAHKFFCRKSQHYVMGDWSIYRKKDYENRRIYTKELSVQDKDYLYYKKNFLRAYIKYMYLTIKTYRAKLNIK